MPIAKIKNLILLILGIAVVCLLCLVVPTKLAQGQEEGRLHQQLEALFASHDIRLDSEILHSTVNLYTIELSGDGSSETNAVTTLLGEGVFSQEDSSRYARHYTAPGGSCTITSSGSFSAALSGSAPVSDAADNAAMLLRDMGFVAASWSELTRVSAGVYRIQATQSLLGVPVFSNGLSLTYTNSALTAVSGVFFTGTITRVDETACISCADALVALLAARNALGWVGGEILSVEQGYQHTETASATIRLIPGWRIETDTAVFFVNGVTGEISQQD